MRYQTIMLSWRSDLIIIRVIITIIIYVIDAAARGFEPVLVSAGDSESRVRERLLEVLRYYVTMHTILHKIYLQSTARFHSNFVSRATVLQHSACLPSIDGEATYCTMWSIKMWRSIFDCNLTNLYWFLLFLYCFNREWMLHVGYFCWTVCIHD